MAAPAPAPILGQCMGCKCTSFEGAPSNPTKVCICGHWKSFHRIQKNFAVPSGSVTNALIQGGSRTRSVRLPIDFWEKLAEEQQHTAASSVESLRPNDRRSTINVTNALSNPYNYNPYRSAAPGSSTVTQKGAHFLPTPKPPASLSRTNSGTATHSPISASTSSSGTALSAPASVVLSSLPASHSAPDTVTSTPSTLPISSAHSSSASASAIPALSVSSEDEPSTSLLSAGSVLPSQSPRAAKKSQREMVLAEFLDTEQAYVDDLTTMIQYYLQPLRKLELIPTNDILAIFSNVETILHLNKSILAEFNVRRSQDPNPIIGDILLKMSAYFKMYTSYCANHDASLKVLDKMRKNPLVAKFFEEQKGRPACRGINCEGFLIKPIQRLCKYPLLLRELIKVTPEEHPDYQNLISAQKQIEDVVTYVNEGRRSAENQQKIVDIQDSFDVDLQLVSPSRRLLREGKLTLLSNGHTRSKQVYLFNDLLLIRRGRSKPLQGAIEELGIINHADQETLKNVFEVTFKGTGETMALFSFPSEEEKNQWFKDIKKLIEEVQRKDIREIKRKATLSSIEQSPQPASSRKNMPPPSATAQAPSSTSSLLATASSPSPPSEEGKIDGWLLGFFIWHKVTGKKLFDNLSLAEMVEALATQPSKAIPNFPEDLPPGVTELLQLCWQPSGGSRQLPLKEVLEHLEAVEPFRKKKNSRKMSTMKAAAHRLLGGGSQESGASE